MKRIHLLDIQTANSIAAGEVVERPASVIKELCENSLDAGSTQISIRVEQGGIKYIQVLDNGSGMHPEDAKLAFLPHATSKLNQIDDLDNLITMGFRGEALASISAVAKVKLVTRSRESESAIMLTVEGGEWSEPVPTGAPYGTSITVENLFFNTPARFKFLKKDSTELNKIIDVVEKLAIARPDVAFILKSNEKVLIHTPGNNDLTSTIFSVFGKNVAQDLIEIPESVNIPDNPLQITGAIGQPGAARNSRNGQLFFLNNRPIKDVAVTKAIDEAFRGRLMKGKYPIAILKLELPQYLADINVHPQKSEVRFWNSGAVFNSVYHVIKSILENDVLPPGDWSQNEVEKVNDYFKAPGKLKNLNQGIEQIPLVPSAGDDFASANSSKHIESPQVRPYVECKNSKNEENNTFNEVIVNEYLNTDTTNDYSSQLPKPDLSETKNTNKPQNEVLTNPKPLIGVEDKDVAKRLSGLKIIGQVFNTYIILEDTDTLWLIDQHAAHEKILFEKFYKDFTNKELPIQPLLFPQTIVLTTEDKIIAMQEKTAIEMLGFEFDDFDGNNIILRAIPSYIPDADPETAFIAIIDYLNSDLRIDEENWLNRQAYDIIAEISCKAAIKGNDNLDEMEIKQLLSDLEILNQPYNCPHGRPVIIRMSKYELEKRFKRIL